MERPHALDIWVHARRVGRLEALNSSPRSYVFTYGTQVPEDSFISLSMPVEGRLFEDGALFPIFEQNLPEGELKSVLGTRYSKLLTLIDDFDYLSVCGPYWRGRVRISEVDGEPKEFGEPLKLSELLNQDSRALFDELIGKYGFATATRSGVQPKLALQISDDGEIFPDQRATLWTEDKIVKFENDDTEFPGIVVNEFVSMTAARESGIPVPGFTVSDDGKRLVVDRFDETKGEPDLGFEEAATLMLFHATEKYSSSYDRMCRTLLEEISPQHRDAARVSLAKQMLLMILIGNGDAHLKNFGVIYSGADDVRLAPAYDVVCTTLYLKNDLPALGFEGRNIWFSGNALISRVAKVTGLSAEIVARSLEEVKLGINRAVDEGFNRFRSQAQEMTMVQRLADHWQARQHMNGR